MLVGGEISSIRLPNSALSTTFSSAQARVIPCVCGAATNRRHLDHITECKRQRFDCDAMRRRLLWLYATNSISFPYPSTTSYLTWSDVIFAKNLRAHSILLSSIFRKSMLDMEPLVSATK